jgi:hypothetical protein
MPKVFTSPGKHLSLSTHFVTKKGGRAMIKFLEETKVCLTPVEHPFDPG